MLVIQNLPQILGFIFFLHVDLILKKNNLYVEFRLNEKQQLLFLSSYF